MKTRKQMLEEFLAQDPGDSFSRYALALELEKEGKQGEAISRLQEVVGRDPAYVAAYYHLGRLLSQRGQIDEARATYRSGLEAARSSGDQRSLSEIEEALDLLG